MSEETTALQSDEIEAETVDTEAQAEVTEEAFEEDAEEQSATPEDEPQEKPKRRSRAEERINALTREKYEAQKQVEAYQQQLAQIQQHIQSQQQMPDMPDIPKLSDFDYDENRYQQAIAQWNNQQRQQWEAQQRTQYEQQQMAMAQQREMALIQQKAAEGAAKYPDFQQKVFDPNLPPLREVNSAAFQAVLESDAAADVAYYLASNPGEVYAFASLNPVQAIRKVAQIEAQLAAKPMTKTVPPRPPTRVSGNSEAVKDPNKMTTEEWIEWRNRQIQSKLR